MLSQSQVKKRREKVAKVKALISQQVPNIKFELKDSIDSVSEYYTVHVNGESFPGFTFYQNVDVDKQIQDIVNILTKKFK